LLPDAVIILDSGGKVVYWNRAAEDLYGYGKSDAVGKSMGELFADHALDGVHIAEVKSSDGWHADECTRRTKLGDAVFVERRHAIRKGADGAGVSVVELTRDISSVKNRERELVSAAARLKMALQSSKIGTWEYDIASAEATWDEQMYANFGFDKAKFDGSMKMITERIHPDDREGMSQAVKNAISSGTEYQRSYRVVMDDGSIRYLESRGAVLGDMFDRKYLIGISIDITHRIETERALKEGRKKLDEKTRLLELILDCTPDGVVAADTDVNLFIFNPAAQKMVGMGVVDSSPDTWPEAYGCYYDEGDTPCKPEDLPVMQALAGKSVHEMQVYLKNKGQPRGVWLSCNAEPLRDETDFVVGAVVIMRDITTTRRAAILTKQRDQFATTLVHDLKNMLVSQDLHFPLMLAGKYGPLSEQQSQMISTFQESNAILWQTAQNLLELFRYEDSEVLRFEPSDLSTILSKCVNAHKTFAKSRNVTLDFVAESNLPKVKADPLAMGQVFNNLIHNAIKYTGDGQPVSVSVKADGNQVTTKIVDKGPGISEEDQRQLFTRFAKGEIGKSDSGTGLGLYLSYQIIKAHDGRLVVDSTLGNGSTFLISLWSH
jgi:PAS domain S-box-containing protein